MLIDNYFPQFHSVKAFVVITLNSDHQILLTLPLGKVCSKLYGYEHHHNPCFAQCFSFHPPPLSLVFYSYGHVTVAGEMQLAD